MINGGFTSFELIVIFAALLLVGLISIFPLLSPAKLPVQQSGNIIITTNNQTSIVGTSTDNQQITATTTTKPPLPPQFLPYDWFPEPVDNSQIDILQPQQNVVLKLGETYTIKWDFPKGPSGADIYLIPEPSNCKNQECYKRIAITINLTRPAEKSLTSDTNSWSYDWLVGEAFYPGADHATPKINAGN